MICHPPTNSPPSLSLSFFFFYLCAAEVQGQLDKAGTGWTQRGQRSRRLKIEWVEVSWAFKMCKNRQGGWLVQRRAHSVRRFFASPVSSA